jgi:hypothetical protein
MAKLNQVIAIEKGIKSQATAAVSTHYKTIQKPELFAGLSKTYQALNADDNEKLPAESKRVQYRVPDLVRAVEVSLSELLQVTARKDWSNCSATADIVVDGKTLLSGVPVTYLLFLEKQVVDIRSFVSTLPTLDEAEDWTYDSNSALYKTAPMITHRTKKAQKPLVLYPATPEHPAQTQLITEDVAAGNWTLIKQSGAIPRTIKLDMLVRVEKLVIAVKEARELANIVDEVKAPDVPPAIFDYLFPSDAFVAGGSVAS